MTVTVRPADPGDVPMLAEHAIRVAKESEGTTLDPVEVRAGTTAGFEHGRFFVAETDHVVGSAFVTTEWSDWRNGVYWWLQSVYVRPGDRGQGVYDALHAAIRDAARAEGALGLRLLVHRDNSVAQRAYARNGMEPHLYRMFDEPL